jgi:hypothetical protein
MVARQSYPRDLPPFLGFHLQQILIGCATAKIQKPRRFEPCDPSLVAGLKENFGRLW